MGRNPVQAAARRAARLLVRPRVVTWAISDDARLRSRVLLSLSNAQARASSFGEALHSSGSPRPIVGFEDCAWLFGSNVMNHGLSRQEFVEAAYLYRLVRGMGQPSVLEVGRYKGGTTFLLAAAGARVTSLDVREVTPGTDHELRGALEIFGFGDRVDLRLLPWDAFPLDEPSFDLVFVDAVLSYDYAVRELARLWDAIKDGCHVILRDGSPYPPEDVRAATVAPMALVAADLEAMHGAVRVAGTPGAYAHFVKSVHAEGSADGLIHVSGAG